MRNVLPGITAILLCGCASMPSDALIGQDKREVTRVLGQPYSEFVQGRSKVMVYPRAPSQKGTFYIELNEAEKVLGWQDVLTYKNFSNIKVGMTVQELEKVIGPALWKWQVVKDNQTVFNYPFDNSICQIFQVTVLPTGVVTETGFGLAPECETFAVN